MDDPFTFLLALACVVVTVVALFCAADTRRRFQNYATGPVWAMFISADFRAAVAGAIMLGIIVYSLVAYSMGWGPIPRPWGAVGLALGYLLHQWGPISRWIALRRIADGDDTEGAVSRGGYVK
jgi:hypothetical protein